MVYMTNMYVTNSNIVQSNPALNESKSGQIPPKGFSSGLYPNRCHESPKNVTRVPRW